MKRIFEPTHFFSSMCLCIVHHAMMCNGCTEQHRDSVSQYCLLIEWKMNRKIYPLPLRPAARLGHTIHNVKIYIMKMWQQMEMAAWARHQTKKKKILMRKKASYLDKGDDSWLGRIEKSEWKIWKCNVHAWACMRASKRMHSIRIEINYVEFRYCLCAYFESFARWMEFSFVLKFSQFRQWTADGWKLSARVRALLPRNTPVSAHSIHSALSSPVRILRFTSLILTKMGGASTRQDLRPFNSFSQLLFALKCWCWRWYFYLFAKQFNLNEYYIVLFDSNAGALSVGCYGRAMWCACVCWIWAPQGFGKYSEPLLVWRCVPLLFLNFVPFFFNLDANANGQHSGPETNFPYLRRHTMLVRFIDFFGVGHSIHHTQFKITLMS